MNKTETLTIVTWLNQFDGRITVADATVHMWQDSLSGATYDETVRAIQDHYRSNETAATPFGIRRVTRTNRERAAAGTSALSARKPEPAMAYADYAHHMDSPQFRELFEAGRRAGNGDRAYRQTLRETGDRDAAESARELAQQS